MLGVFVVAGCLASIGGIMQTGYVGAISANQGNNMIFTVFAAAVIGGISLDGGKGTMLGALTGVLLLGVVQNLLTSPRCRRSGSRPSTAESSWSLS